MYRANNTDIFFDEKRDNLPAKITGELFVPDSTFLKDLVGDCYDADWGHVKNGEKLLSRLSGVSIGTIRGIKNREHGVSLVTAFALAPHMPTLRRKLAELLGFGPSASSEAKKLKLIEQIMQGTHDDTIEKLYQQPAYEAQAELMLH
jgi:hypothetical protein